MDKKLLRIIYPRNIAKLKVGCRRLIRDLQKIVSDESVRRIVSKRIKTFERIGRGKESTFRELCYCILTANYSAEGGLKIQRAVGSGFTSLTRVKLAEKLRGLGYRYPETRAKYIVEARKLYNAVWEVVKHKKDSAKVRKWLADNVLGLGFKEASHFLRNIGFKDLAIIDKHILKVLHKYGLIRSIPKTLSRKRYLKIEKTILKMAEELEICAAELDLYLWYMDTGSILK